MKERTKGFFIGFVLALMLSSTTALIANSGVVREIFFGVNIVLNGNVIEFEEDARPFIIDGRTYLPARAFSEALGIAVDWDETTSTVILGRTSINADALVGKWNAVGFVEIYRGNTWTNNPSISLEFFYDGTVILSEDNFPPEIAQWRIEDALLHLEFYDEWGSEIMAFEVELDDNNLVLTFENWEMTAILTFVRNY